MDRDCEDRIGLEMRSLADVSLQIQRRDLQGGSAMKADRPIARLCGKSLLMNGSLAVCQRSGRDTAGHHFAY